MESETGVQSSDASAPQGDPPKGERGRPWRSCRRDRSDNKSPRRECDKGRRQSPSRDKTRHQKRSKTPPSRRRKRTQCDVKPQTELVDEENVSGAVASASFGPSIPNPTLNLEAVGLHSSGTSITDAHERIFVGGIPDYLTEEQCRELLGKFKDIKSFDLVKDRDTGQSKG